jgi:malonyl-CoA/methylmalonyl-CoA synthetase
VVRHPDAGITEIDIITAARAELAGFKVPKMVLFVETLPRNTMGKVQKNLLRADYGDAFR